MMMRLTLFILSLFLSTSVFAQNKTIRRVNDNEFKSIQKVLKDYEDFLKVNLNDTVYEVQRNFNMRFTPSHLVNSNIQIWNDKDSASPAFLPVFSYVKYNPESKAFNYSARFVFNPNYRPNIINDQLRKNYFLKLPAKKLEMWKEVRETVDTVVSPVYSIKDSVIQSFPAEPDSSKIISQKDSSMVSDSSSVNRYVSGVDSVLTGYDTSFVKVLDTVLVKNVVNRDFYFRATEQGGVFSGFRIYSVSIPGKDPELEPISEEMKWWLALEDEWKDFFREKHKLAEYPEFYEIRRCQGLRELDVSNQPVSDISFLEKFKLLEKLNLSKTNVKDLSPIKDLVSLKELDISGTKVDTLLYLSNLKNLEVLDISGLQIYSLENISGLTNLIELSCNENKIKDLEPLRNMELLEELDISLNYDIKDVTPITGLVNLEKLVLKKVEIKSLEPLTSLVNLVHLDVYNAGINDLGPLRSLTKLMYLDVSHNSVESLAPIRSLRYITNLLISSTRITDLGPVSGYRHLEYLSASGNPGLKDLSPVPNETLNTLIIHYTGISSGEVKRFKKRNPRCKITYY